MAKSGLFCIIAVAIAFLVALGLVLAALQGVPEINSFDDCVKAGNPVMESYPPQCRAPDGRTFVGPLGITAFSL